MKGRILRVLFLPLFLIASGCGGGNSNSPKVQMGGAVQGSPLLLTGAVTTITGTPGGIDGLGAAATFAYPQGITTDGANLYVADSSNNTIRKIVISSGAVTTLAGSVGVAGSADGTGASARFSWPRDLTTDGANLYVTDLGNNTIRKIDISTGAVTTLAGTAGATGATDGIGAAARFYDPIGITTDGTNLYVTELGNTIRKIAISTGAVTTLAGTAGVSGSADGTGAAATFFGPAGIATDGTNLYVTDGWNRTIRKIVISSGAVTTLAGTAGATGATDGIGAAARFYGPGGIATDGTNLFVTDYGNTIRKIVISTGVVTTLAGTATVRGWADGTGAEAIFSGPRGIITDGTNLYVTEYDNNTIRKIVIPTGAVTTLAGNPNWADGTGTLARFSGPSNITTDGTNLFVADNGNHTIRKIDISTGIVTTLAGIAGTAGSADGTRTAALFRFPFGITTDAKNLYVADYGNHTIRKIDISTGTVTTLAGTAGSTAGSTDGVGAEARFSSPRGITTDGTNLYVTENGSSTIRKIDISTGAVTTLAGTAYAVGSTDGTGAAARFSSLRDITTDGTSLFVADYGNNTIRKIEISTGVVSTLAGTAGSGGSADGTGTAAQFSGPTGITIDGTNLYVTDNGSNTVRKIVISSRAVTTLAGAMGIAGWSDGTGTAARFSGIAGITSNGTSLFVTDTLNNAIRRVN